MAALLLCSDTAEGKEERSLVSLLIRAPISWLHLNLLLLLLLSHFIHVPTLCDPTDSSPPGSAVPSILQARILEWVAISFSII